MKKVLKLLLYLIVLILVFFAAFLIYATVNDYRPDEQVTVYTSENSDMLSDTSELTLVSWNIGYCGLNAEMDFFYDGGKHVRPERETVIKNLDNIRKKMQKMGDIDFFLLQEVDKDSKRSWGINQYDSLSETFQTYQHAYGKNYDVFFVPQPVTDPMGHVNGGLMTLGKYEPVSCVRYAFPGNYSWPLGLFFLDRCLLLNRYSLENDKELIVINTHNSAYDDGSLRDQQMNFMKNVIQTEYENGNYVIVGGDWNQCPPNFIPDFKNNKMDNETRKDIPTSYFSEWTWAFDNSAPTNRRVSTPYNVETSPATVIDFYLLSPNIELKKIKTAHLDFENSDHNPVFLKIKLN